MNTTGKCQRIDSAHRNFGDIIELDASHFSRPWNENDWLTLEWSRHLLFIWESSDGRPTGFALFADSDGTAHLLKILLLPERRGSGEASDFWNQVMKSLRDKSFQSVYLEVEETNKRAQRFYEKMGFRTLRSVKSYYSDGQGALMMQLTL